MEEESLMNRPPIAILVIALWAVLTALGATIVLFGDYGKANLWLFCFYLFPICGILLLFRVRLAYWALLIFFGLAAFGGISLIVMTLLNLQEQPHYVEIASLTIVNLLLFVALRGKTVRNWLYRRSNNSINPDAQNPRAG
jgi:hypothetical protein